MTMTDATIDPIERAQARAAEMLAMIEAGQPVTALGIGDDEQGVAETVVYERERDRAGEITAALQSVAVLEFHGETALPAFHGVPPTEQDVRSAIERDVTKLAVLISDELAGRIVDLLPPAVVERERLEVVRCRQPAILTVETFDTYRCDLTGQDHTGPAVVLTAREGSSLSDGLAQSCGSLRFSPSALQAVLDEIPSGSNADEGTYDGD